ncbi:hypothetical protein P4493_05855 [Bacillus thuringiensis]|uniref:Uncharacterized protein n=3 Tax=Bacillus thuringiensis TaxID=1428 RepID=A0A0B5NK83_BACTU|nr:MULTISPECIES: hypothetical protein [Bacillus]EAO51414.1 hypothetical protein RBTH_02392 [Bacillus thuringiensis serovar israelensis ATCC 35646]MEC2533087.1 hypothetical protein [Bacillus cereus]MED1153933.1 hypothetical protein [Bacillus paranthracis]OUB09227.1 hypothetical protein BK708_32340 [Bacillus thuringiensis serovar yunnanensis]AFQ29805.1 hypothetical protein BTF1_28522 [Bacillus thuringiensis HD-789]
MIKVYKVTAKDSNIVTLFVYDGNKNLLMDSPDVEVLDDFLDLLNLGLSDSPQITDLETISIEKYSLEVSIKTKGFMKLDELPKYVKQVKGIVVEGAEEPYARVEVLCYVHVGNQEITFYKPLVQSEYFNHPFNLLDGREFDNLPPFKLFL